MTKASAEHGDQNPTDRRSKKVPPARLLSRVRSKGLLPPALVLLVGTLASLLAAAQVHRVAFAKDQERFHHAVVQAEDSIASRIDTYMAMLRATAGFLITHERVARPDTFQVFVAQLKLQERYPGIQGIGFSAKLEGQIAESAQSSLHAFGRPNLAVHPSGRRDEIHAIVLLEPGDRRNQAALGYDMFSEPVRRAAMERARDTGHGSASGRVQLVQEIEGAKQAGFLIYLPVYTPGPAPRNVSERRGRLVGFVYSPFRADDLLRGIFGRTPDPRVHLDIYDGPPRAENLLHRSPGERAPAPRFVATRHFDVPGRAWTIVYSVRPGFEAASSRGFALIVLLGGLFATMIISGATWAQSQAKCRADKSAEVSRAHARELEVLHDAAGKLAAELDRDRLMQAVTDFGRELAGAEIGAFFYNVVGDQGETLQLFTLSGAPRDAFASMGVPRNTAVFGPTFRGEGPVRVDDITEDPRYGRNAPRKGFPDGHWPVRSYLAVPVMSRSGAVLGGLFFGHSESGVFTEAAERSVVALAGHAAIAIDNAKLFKAAQEEIAARKVVEEQQKLLLDELNHRVKNTLATIQSISAQTARSSETLETFYGAFESRLIALSEAHNLLSASNWRGVMLGDLVRRELTPHGLGDAGRFSVSGPDIWLGPAATVTLGMALHELATNASKYGALSSSRGHVDVSWELKAEGPPPLLRLIWRESGGPPVAPPQRQGFGSRMIERGLRHDLRGEARLHFDPAGLRCVIEAPLKGVDQPL